MDENRAYTPAQADTPPDSAEAAAYTTLAPINEAHRIDLVQQTSTGKILVKKILDVYNINIYERLYRNHITGTPEIISYREENGELTVIEEYISGISLQEKIKNSDLTAVSILSYMSDLCVILKQLHEQQPPIIHRDIKPGNVIITPYNRAVLLDFNAAKYYNPSASADTLLLGTEGYASPEQYGFGTSTPQSDIYALGILLKEMCASIQLNDAQLHAVINTCTQIMPSNRYKNVEALDKILRRSLRKYRRQAQDSDTAGFSIPNLHEYALPGFRTRSANKMITASLAYIFMAVTSAFVQVKNATSVGELWLYRIASFIIMLSVVLAVFNYCDIQKMLPLCKHKNPKLKTIGIALLVFFLVFCDLLVFIIIRFLLFQT